MRKNRMKLSYVYFLALSMVVLLFVGAVACVRASNFDIPIADVTYGVGGDYPDWEGTLEINRNLTVKVSGLKHENTESGDAAIRICEGATVNLVFEGENVLSAREAATAAGIQVENGSTVNIYGLDGSSLTVTGGNWSAGIGGIGYSGGTENPACGNINIYSGNITAIGGDKGAAIGSGNHSSASAINIMSGNITALGTGGGAGIGSGYGTSGGSTPKVGFYNGGNITISGGTIKAAGYHMNFDNFDQYNTDTLYGEGYSDTFAAGIGGGYGASSGNIIIEGEADVIAIGSCGGTGIGSGRGRSKEKYYDAEHFDVSITIRGNSKVVAMATDDRRPDIIGDDGGAAIGLGRGCTIDGDPKGAITIEGNASVYAVAPDHAQAIGASCVVGEFKKDEEGNITRPAAAHVKSLTISATSIVMAVGDEYREAIDKEYAARFLLLNMDKKNYFEERGDFFTEDKFPLKIEALNADRENSKMMFAVQKLKTLNIMVHILGASRYNFIIKDYQGENREIIFLSNSAEENSAQFFSDPEAVKEYGVTGLTTRLDREGSMDSDYGALKLKIEAREGIFEYGSTFFCDRIEDPYVIDELNSKLDKEYADKLERILYFDIGVKDRNGEKYTEFKGGKVKVYVEIPNGWDKDEVLALFVRALGDETFTDTQKLEVIDGVTYLSFEIDHFSKYALFDPNKEENEHHENNEHNESDPEEENGIEINNEESSENNFLSTGDKILILCTALILVMIISLGCMAFLFREPGKRFKR